MMVDSTTNYLSHTAPDIMLMSLTTDDLRDKESRVIKKRKADREQTILKDMIGPQKITTLEIGYVADTRYDNKYKAKIQQH